jgi:DNA-binding transcriptional MerR regulator
VALKLFRAADVCASTGLQPYVLRSWEKEFPGIGVQRTQDSARFYRQSDVEQVLRIKELVFGEGLTLAGARRRLETLHPGDESAAESAEMAEVLDTLGADARARIGSVRSGLRSILEVLSRNPGSVDGAEPTVLRDATSSEGGRGQRSVRSERAKASEARPRAGRGEIASSKRAGATKRVSKRL